MLRTHAELFGHNLSILWTVVPRCVTAQMAMLKYTLISYQMVHITLHQLFFHYYLSFLHFFYATCLCLPEVFSYFFVISDDCWKYGIAMGLLSVPTELKYKQSHLRENPC